MICSFAQVEGRSVFESSEELEQVQELLDRCFERRRKHATAILTEERRLNARQVVTYLQDVKHVVMATVTAANEPFARTAFFSSKYVHGPFCFPAA